MPLRTGAEAGGVANFGVVEGFKPLPGLPAPTVLAVDALDVVEALEPLDEPLEEPQPASAASAVQAIAVERPLLIGAPTLA